MPNINQFATREEYKNWYREYRKKNTEKLRKYNREYNRVYREKAGYKNEENARKKYPEKDRARRLLRYAVRIGSIKKLNCLICNIGIKIQGHHDDYSKPLEVVWLCPRHHAERHRKLNVD